MTPVPVAAVTTENALETTMKLNEYLKLKERRNKRDTKKNHRNGNAADWCAGFFQRPTGAWILVTFRRKPADEPRHRQAKGQ
jgi:hypothetical protein